MRDLSIVVAETLLDASLRSLWLAAIVGVLLWLSRVRDSRVDHAAWTAVSVAMLAMLAVGPLVPPLTSPAVPTMPAVTFPDLPRELQLETIPEAAVNPVRPMVPAPSTAQPLAVAGRSEARSIGWPTMLTVAVVLYAAVALTLLTRLAAGWWLAARLLRGTTRIMLPDGALARESAVVTTPLTLGVWRAHIVLPIAWREWPARTLAAVLAHERAHVARRDPLTTFVVRLTRIAFWFHPLAWWLERRVRAAAEFACDDAVVRATRDADDYAGVLVTMARSAQQGRVAWQALGVGGGFVEQRVTRVIDGVAGATVSPLRTVLVLAACTAAIVHTAACRSPQPASPASLQRDATYAEELAQQERRRERDVRAARMTVADLGALEARILAGGATLDEWRDLRVFYEQRAQREFGWNEMVVRRRPLIVASIEQHAEELGMIWLVSAAADPDGYAAAKRAWLARTERPDVTAMVLSNATRFFTAFEPRLAEQLLLRARSLDATGATMMMLPGRPVSADYWSRRLGDFYGNVLTESERRLADIKSAAPVGAGPNIDAAFLGDVRRRLLASNDARLLDAAGVALMRFTVTQPLADEVLGRAMSLDPNSPLRLYWNSREFSLHSRERYLTLRVHQARMSGGNSLAERVRQGVPLSREEQLQLETHAFDAVAMLPPDERVQAYTELAANQYFQAEALARSEPERAVAKLAMSSRAASAAVAGVPDLAADHPALGFALYNGHIALGLAAAREGNRADVLAHLHEASRAPASALLDIAVWGGLGLRLAWLCLDAGEYDAVATFLERAAALKPESRTQLLQDAATIRGGAMPRSYQRYLANR